MRAKGLQPIVAELGVVLIIAIVIWALWQCPRVSRLLFGEPRIIYELPGGSS